MSQAIIKKKKSAAASPPKKESWAMTEAEEIEEAVRAFYASEAGGRRVVPASEKEFMTAMLAADAPKEPEYTPPADAALAWELMQAYPNFWELDFQPPADDPRWKQLADIQAGIPPPPPPTPQQEAAAEDAVPPPYGTKEFFIWWSKKRARINAERAAAGLPPLPTKKEKEAAEAKKREERQAAKAAKEKEKADKVAARLAKAEAKAAKAAAKK